MAEQRIDLLTKGCLGTCWYGKYHYLEPWVGCEHDCDYCYARFRKAVSDSIQVRGSVFARPVLQMPLPELKTRLAEDLVKEHVQILKISRFTDFFCSTTMQNGWTREVLEVILAAPVKRVIITTKGAPDEDSLKLMEQHPERFSFNVVAKPESELGFESRVPPLEARLSAAERLNQAGVLTTIHMDPLVPGIEDQSPGLEEFADLLARRGLKRVMLSLLLLNDPMISLIRSRLGPAGTEKLVASYDLNVDRQFLPGQEETFYYQPRPEVRRECLRHMNAVLRERGFSFVLCSLKSGAGGESGSEGCPRCDGKFYA